MPSRVVDAMWHEFILHTRAYGEWCDLTVGRFVHHTPALALGSVAKHNDGLRRAWFWACRDEGIDPRLPTRLPLLFALDGKLGIAGGFRYQTGFLPARAAQPGDSGEANYGSSFSDGSYPGESLDAADFGGSDSGATGGADGDGDGSGGCGGD